MPIGYDLCISIRPRRRSLQVRGGSVRRHAPTMLKRRVATAILAATMFVSTTSPATAEERPALPVGSRGGTYLAFPIEHPPLRFLGVVEPGLLSNLARCHVPERPLCDTGVTCLAWVTYEIEINAAGRVEHVAVVGRCPARPLPEDPWARMQDWFFNPKIENGRPVAVRGTITLAYPLGVAS